MAKNHNPGIIEEISAAQEVERTKRACAVAYEADIMPSFANYKTRASISPAITSNITITSPKPVLEKPVIYKLAEITQLQERVGNKDFDRAKRVADRAQKKMQKLSSKEAEDLEKYLEADPHTLWKVLYHTASYTAAASAIVLGAAAISAGSGGIVLSATIAGLANSLGISAATLYGNILIFSGVANIGNMVMRETNGWYWVASKFTSDKNTQNKIAAYAQTATTVVSVATGLFAGYASSAISIVSDWSAKAIDIASKTSNIAYGISNFAIGKAEFDKLNFESELTLSREAKSKQQNKITRTIKDIRQVVQGQKAFHNAVADAMRAEEEMKRIINKNTAAVAG